MADPESAGSPVETYDGRRWTVAVGPALVLIAPQPELVAAWGEAFAPFVLAGRVRTQVGLFQDVLDAVDGLLTPGNSYGQMDGGIDEAISRHFPPVQRSVWDAIGDHHRGFLPVGSATIVPTGAQPCRWLVYAPTMRIPMRLDGGRDVAVHDALWAGLLAVERHNDGAAEGDRIMTLACPGLGTGFGGVTTERAARLMAAAYELWCEGSTAAISRRERLLEPRG